MTEVEEMFNTEDSLNHEFMLNQRWAVREMIQCYESDSPLDYIHGCDAGIDFLCARAGLSNPAMAKGIEDLAAKMAEEIAKALRSMLGAKNRLLQWHPRSRPFTGWENGENKLEWSEFCHRILRPRRKNHLFPHTRSK